MKKKVSLSQNFYLVKIPSCEAHKHCRAEIAQYRLEIIFKCLIYQQLLKSGQDLEKFKCVLFVKLLLQTVFLQQNKNEVIFFKRRFCE